MEVVTGDGVRLNVVVDGPEGGPVLVIAHGITSSAAEFGWLVPRLVEQGYRVVRPEFRGHGRSERAERYDGPDCVVDLVAVLEAVGEPCLVLGHSLGGVAALGAAQARPELVRSVFALDPAVSGADADDDVAASLGDLTDIFRLIHTAMPHLQASGISVDAFAQQLLEAPTPHGRPAGEVYVEGTTHAWAESQLQLDVEVLRRLVDPAAPRTPVPLDLDAPFDVPVLVVRADPAMPDGIVSDEHVARMEAAGSRDLEVVTVAGGGHSLQDERAHRDTFLAHLDRWLAACGAAATGP